MSPLVTTTTIADGCDSADPEHDGGASGSRGKRSGGNPDPRRDVEDGGPPARTAGGAGAPAPGQVPGHHEVGRDQATPRRHQSPDDGHGNGEGRVCDDAECLPGQPQIDGVGGDHADIAIGETPAECPDPVRVQFDRDDTRTDTHQGIGQGTVTGPDIEHEVTGGDPGGRHHAFGPAPIEPVPPPPPRVRGVHGTSPSSS